MYTPRLSSGTPSRPDATRTKSTPRENRGRDSMSKQDTLGDEVVQMTPKQEMMSTPQRKTPRLERLSASLNPAANRERQPSREVIVELSENGSILKQGAD